MVGGCGPLSPGEKKKIEKKKKWFGLFCEEKCFFNLNQMGGGNYWGKLKPNSVLKKISRGVKKRPKKVNPPGVKGILPQLEINRPGVFLFPWFPWALVKNQKEKVQIRFTEKKKAGFP